MERSERRTVTAVEIDPELTISRDMKSNCCNAHEYLLKHYKFDFIWTPPCPK